MLGEEETPHKAAQPEWPPMPEEDDTYVAAMRAADALFARAPEPQPAPEGQAADAAPSTASAEPARRILQSLNEDDHISRLLAEEDEHRPRRGRRPREDGEPAPQRSARVLVEHDAEASPDREAARGSDLPAEPIPGYVRGQIYARYARHTQARPGEQWRKRSLKPLW